MEYLHLPSIIAALDKAMRQAESKHDQARIAEASMILDKVRELCDHEIDVDDFIDYAQEIFS